MFYPVFLELKGRTVLVVGGGTVAEHKVESLLNAEAVVHLVSPGITPRLSNLCAKGLVVWTERPFQECDLHGTLLVISATDDPEMQKQVAAAARARNILVNTVDQPLLCDFIVPAVVKNGAVIAAISTSGKSPALAAALRARLTDLLSENVARTADLLGSVRSEVHSRFADVAARKRVFEKIIDSKIIDWIGECDDATALKRIREMIDEA